MMLEVGRLTGRTGSVRAYRLAALLTEEGQQLPAAGRAIPQLECVVDGETTALKPAKDRSNVAPD
jgi:hypothetical protein